MLPFSADELAFMDATTDAVRGSQAQRMPELATVVARVWADDGAGGQVLLPPTTVTLPCRIRSATSLGNNEPASASGITPQQNVFLDFPYGTVINIGARVTIGARGFEISQNVSGSYATVAKYAAVER